MSRRSGKRLETNSLKGGLTCGAYKGAQKEGGCTCSSGRLMDIMGSFNESHHSGTSIFDPVLCEMAYRWFCPPGGLVLDPFAGGSVRGIVASVLGRRYVGIELRPEQVEENRAQAERICHVPLPVWHVGDSRGIDRLAQGVTADFVFSCPPYADLEVYSDNPADLSTLGYSEFIPAYREIIAKTAAMLREDAFACFVVGEVRDKKGMYYGFVPDTVRAFEDAGLRYYNEAILITMIGSLPIRAGRQFERSRKIGKTHQNILIFCKGDPKRAAANIGPVDFGEIGAGPEGEAFAGAGHDGS